MIAREANPDLVRVATWNDAAELMDICRADHAENGVGSFSAEKVSDVFRRAFEPGANEIAVIGVLGDACIEGSIGLAAETAWNSETPVLSGLWAYVRPQYRASPNFKDLLAFAARLAEPMPVGLGIPVSMRAIVTARTEGQVRHMRRHLGDPCAFVWLRESTYGGTH